MNKTSQATNKNYITSRSIIDHVLTSTAFKDSISPYTLCEDISNHLPVCAVLTIKQFQKSIKRPYTRNFSQEKINLFLDHLYNNLSSKSKAIQNC